MPAYRAAGGAAIASMVLAGSAMVAAQAPVRIPLPSMPPPSLLPPVAPGPSDPAAQVTVSVDGRSVLISGSLLHGTAMRLALALESAPQARTVVLQSPGGILGEAARLAEVIRSHRLDTQVETFCASACTIVLMAGRERAIAPYAAIGFHRPVNQDYSPLSAEDVTLTRAFYEEAGLSPTFVDRTYATPHEQMWEPSYAELRAGNVATRLTLGGETAAGMSRHRTRESLRQAMLDVPFWRSLSSRHPAVAESAFSAMWTAKQSGATDLDVMRAGRQVLSAQMPVIIASATDQHLDQYLTVITEQLVAARALSADACVRMTSGRLDTGVALPRALVDRELALLDRIVSQPASAAAPDRASGERLLREVVAAMPPAQAAILYHPERPASDAARCDATIALMRGVSGLEEGRRRQLARFLFGSPREP